MILPRTTRNLLPLMKRQNLDQKQKKTKVRIRMLRTTIPTVTMKTTSLMKMMISKLRKRKQK